MAVDIFLKMDGIPGESQDFSHKEEIVLESFSWGETNTVPGSAFAGASGQVGRTGRVSMQDFHFTHNFDKASPKLMFAAASGQHIKDAMVTLRKGSASQENQFEFLVYKFTNVIITGVADAGGHDGPPVESVSFAFQKINVEYKPQTPTGGVAAAVTFAWDLAANKKA